MNCTLQNVLGFAALALMFIPMAAFVAGVCFYDRLTGISGKRRDPA